MCEKRTASIQIFDTAPYGPENTVTTVRPRLSKLIGFFK